MYMIIITSSSFPAFHLEHIRVISGQKSEFIMIVLSNRNSGIFEVFHIQKFSDQWGCP